jgi:sugar/nucleoside kinase (ribokinase family)
MSVVDASGRGSPRGVSICTIGDLLLDVIVRPVAPLRADGDTPATIRLCPGGQAANVAAWAAELGAGSRLICVRGGGPAGELAAGELRRRGVTVCGPVVPEPGGIVVSLADRGGERTMASDRGSAAQLTPADIDPAWLSGCDRLHVSGYCLLSEPMAAAAAAAARLARVRSDSDAGPVSVSVDLASAHDIERLGVPAFCQRVRAVGPDLVFATEAERAAVSGLDAAQWVIKRGARGARFPEGELPATAPSGGVIDVTGAGDALVIDVTGAGDALAAGYLVGGPELAMAAAARCVAQVGAMPPTPARRSG